MNAEFVDTSILIYAHHGGAGAKHHKSWDALILNSAIELGCEVLWTEDLADGRKYGTVTARSPF